MKSKESSIQVAVALIQHDGRYLIAQRLNASPLGGYWEFPGGKCMPGESYEDCLRREMREELGVEVEVLGLYRVIEHAYPDRTVLLYFYRCRIMSGEPQALGSQEIRWAKREELGQYRFPPANEKLIQELMSEI
ncbi:MAG TPA: 8-oxo-dGTP diphosphatase MutT [Nitrospiria bacterium]|nr:8-oxo-dGTP diphosphatase MutT [Nitrospiria bacterium]